METGPIKLPLKMVRYDTVEGARNVVYPKALGRDFGLGS